MKKFLQKSLFISLAVLGVATMASAQNYYWNFGDGGSGIDPGNHYTSGVTVLGGTASADDVYNSVGLTIPFAWSFYGTAVTQYIVSDNGYMTFDISGAGGASDATNVALPAAGGPNNAIYAMWDDFELDITAGVADAVVINTYGTAPNRQHVIMWCSASQKSGTNIWAWSGIALNESGGFDIFYPYGLNTLAATMTVGCENATGTVGVNLGASPSFAYPATSIDPDPADDVVYKFQYGTQPANDVRLNGTNVEDFYLITAAPFTFSGDFRNLGTAAVTGLDVAYSIDGGSPVSETVSASAAVGGTGTFNLTTGWTPPATGAYTIDVTVTAVNGSTDPNMFDNTSSHSSTVVDIIVPRTPMIEDFGSSTCPPCATLNAYYDPVLAANNVNQVGGKVTAVKYQMNWPGAGDDPSYNNDGLTRRTYYNVTGIPSTWMDGGDLTVTGTMATDQMTIDDQINVATFMTIQAERTIELNSTSGEVEVGVDVTVTPYADYTGTDIRLFVAVTEDHYTYTFGSTSQTEYEQVAQKMLPDGDGTVIGPLTDGTDETYSGSYSFPIGDLSTDPAQAVNNYNIWTDEDNLTVVVWVQDMSTGSVHQSTVAVAPPAPTPTGPIGIETVDAIKHIGVFPNPAVDNVTLQIALGEAMPATISIVNTLGQEVAAAANHDLNEGNNLINFNTTDLTNGVYFVKIVTNNSDVVTQKFQIAK